MGDVVDTGRRLRPATLGVGALAVAGAMFVWWRGAGDEPLLRGPAAISNPAWAPPAVSVAGSARHRLESEPRELLVPDTVPPDGAARLMWLGGRPASPTADGGAVVLDGAGGVLVFDGALRARRPVRSGGREIVSAAGDAGGGFWLAGVDGVVLRAASSGELQEIGQRAFDYPVLASDPRQPGVWLARRHQRWDYRLPTGDEPLLVGLDTAGNPWRRIGSVLQPKSILLSELASAGHVAVLGDRVFFAPFIYDQVIAFSAAGDTVWVASRNLPQSTKDLDFEVADGSPALNYHPVNLGLVVGPDGWLYVLSTPGFSTVTARLDAYDPATGELRRTARLPTALPTLAADASGRVYALDEFTLLTGIDPREREALASFDSELLSGGRLTSAALEERVTLVNFWASWCAPCRAEMPALDSLRRSITDPRFQFLTMNEDVSVADAESFVREFGFTFPVVVGRGRLRERYHYTGLPFTVLVDGDGRIVQQWIGFAGPEQIEGIRAIVAAELGRRDVLMSDASHAHH